MNITKEIMGIILAAFIIGLVLFLFIAKQERALKENNELMKKAGREQFAMEAIKSGHACWGSDTNGNPVFMWKDTH